jgi:hypothetical protein
MDVLIWVSGEADFFLKMGLDRQITKRRIPVLAT